MSTPEDTPSVFPLTIGGLTLVGWDGFSYVAENGCTFWSGAAAPSEADATDALVHRRAVPRPADPTPIGTRLALGGTFSHEEIATSSGGTLIGFLPAGWALVDFQALVDVAFNAGCTISLGTAASPARWVNALPVSTTGLKQATPLQLYPQSVANATAIYLKKSTATTVGDIIKVTVIIEKKYQP